MQAMQLIDGEGVFNADGLDNFVKKGKLAACGLSYAVVAIMGPQSSGKSTLMNHLFGTNFREMNAEYGWTQTTQGIWLGECVGIEPFTIVMDLEGNDGKERGEDIVFEKQAALFALAVSDILLINIYNSDLGRLNAGNIPLLKTIFEVVLQSPGARRGTTLMFIVRDYDGRTRLAILEKSFGNAVQKIWDEVPKHENHKHTRLLDTYRVEVVALPHYIHEKDKFVKEVATLRERFQNSINSKGLASGGGRRTVVPALDFSFSSQKIWEAIKKNEDLDLPAHRIMVAKSRCDKIANNKLDQLRKNQVWLDLKRDVQKGPVQGFGEKLRSIITTCLSEYDVEVQYLDKEIRKTKRKEVLERKASEEVFPAYETMLQHLHDEALKSFKAKMDQSNKSQIEPDLSKRKDKLYESVFTFAGAAIIDFDRRSLECLVAIEKHEQTTISTTISNLMTLFKGFNHQQTMISNIMNLFKGVNPFKGSTSEGIKTIGRFPIFDIIKDINPFYTDSANNYFKWNPSRFRDSLRYEMDIYARELFMQLCLDPSTNYEDAHKIYKKGWMDWLLRMFGMILDWFN